MSDPPQAPSGPVGPVSAGASPTGDAGGLRSAVDDVLATLDRFNRDVNGDVSSQVRALPRGVVAAVDRIVSWLVESAASAGTATARADAATAATEVSIAWTAILVGDVDDLAEHVALELRARR